MLAVFAAGSAVIATSADSQPVPQPDSRKRFVLDVVHMAVALPQGDPQDRLRVLSSAASVVGPLDRNLARRFAREGAHLEAELANSGQKPAASMLASGHLDCASQVEFIESITPAALPRAEDSLVIAITSCKRAVEPARAKLDAALASGIVAARPLLAMMEISGPSSRWSQDEFAKMFAFLPDQPGEAPNFAAMFVNMAPKVDKDVARDSGVKFLEWLGNLKDDGERNLAVTMTTTTLEKVLGKEAYAEALRSNVVAQSVAQTAGRPGQIRTPEEDHVSVLEAIGNNGKDRTDAIRTLPPSERARQAAAHGFASGTAGDRKAADRYFDVAFAATDEVWAQRTPQKNAAAVVEEVSEAAAQVDPVSALTRAQSLQDPSAQAIGMLAVARTVMGRQSH
jgi:hypothetical protein